jgi:uncharacterized protein YkwD
MASTPAAATTVNAVTPIDPYAGQHHVLPFSQQATRVYPPLTQEDYLRMEWEYALKQGSKQTFENFKKAREVVLLSPLSLTGAFNAAANGPANRPAKGGYKKHTRNRRTRNRRTRHRQKKRTHHH